MIDRRKFGRILAGTGVATLSGCVAGGPASDAEARSAVRGEERAGVALYASVGETLTHYDVSVGEATLDRRAAVVLPANVQYAWTHPSRRWLYVTSSNGGPGSAGDKHHVTAFRIRKDGSLEQHDVPVALVTRPIHNSVDPSGRFLLVAYNAPSGVSVHRLRDDGGIGEVIAPSSALDAGIYAHQILVVPSQRNAILVTRGNDAAGGKPEDPGAIKWMRFRDGALASVASIAPGGGYGFGPRHLDFHPTQPFIYVSIERQNALHAYGIDEGGLAATPRFVRTTLAEPHNERPRQLAGPIHVHPGGRFVYVAKRADATFEHEGRRVFRGGENSIAVFRIDPSSGEPILIEHVYTRGIHVRTFTLDSSGRLLVAASIMPLEVRQGPDIVTLAAGLLVFRIGTDGRLAFVRKYDVETAGKTQWWCGMTGLVA